MKLSLIDWVSDADLRKVGRRSEALARVARRHGMVEEGDAVVFVNSTLTRFRFVVLAGGIPMMLLPPSASKYDILLSIFLRVSLFVQATHRKTTSKTRMDRVDLGKKAVMERSRKRDQRKRRKERA